MFQMCFMDPNQGSASATYISEKKLGTKIAVIWKNDDVYSKGPSVSAWTAWTAS